MTSKPLTVGLLMLGTFLIACSRIKHPQLELFSDAMAYVGGAALAFANTGGLMGGSKATGNEDDKPNH